MGLRTFLVLLLVISPVFVSGCRTPKSKLMGIWANRDKGEVEGDAPPRRPAGRARISLSSPEGETPSAVPDAVKAGADIALTEFNPAQEIIEFDGATIVATVNSIPIFASDILEPYTLNLRQAEKQHTPEEVNLIKRDLIQKHMQPHIEKAVLVSALREDLDKEKMDQLDVQMEAAFKDEIERLKKQANVGTRVELEEVLGREGVRLDTLKTNFAARQMAMFYIGQKANAKVQFSRQELLDWYNAHKEEYAIEALARWQQIRISYGKSGGKTQAAKIMQQVVAALRAGEDFGKVATEFSDGPRKAKAGVWDWTAPGSLAEENVDRAIWDVEVGSISQVLQTNSAFVLVKVLERKGGGYTPFEDVQDAINEKLVTDSRTSSADKVVQDLMATASIETIFDTDAPQLPNQLP
jgi:hypothetical protein